MWRRQGSQKAHRATSPALASVAVGALLLFVPSGIAEASWCPIEGGSEILAASSSPVGAIIKQAVGQSISLLMMAVAIIIAVPVLIAGLAFCVSYVFSRAARRLEKQRRHPRKSVRAEAFTRAS